MVRALMLGALVVRDALFANYIEASRWTFGWLISVVSCAYHYPSLSVVDCCSSGVRRRSLLAHQLVEDARHLLEQFTVSSGAWPSTSWST